MPIDGNRPIEDINIDLQKKLVNFYLKNKVLIIILNF